MTSMREGFLETLMYLFENFVDKGTGFRTKPENIVLEMIRVGYEPRHIKNALGWFAKLDQAMLSLVKSLVIFDQPSNSTRIYSEDEKQKITLEARSYLSYLEQLQLIDAPLRELIIHCATCFNEVVVNQREIKSIVLIVLYKSPEKREQLRMLEYLLLHEEYESVKH